MSNIQTINKVRDILYERLSYTNQDYNSIVTELIELLGSDDLNTNWDNVSEADIIFIMLSLMAAHKDILNYMVDYRTLEGYMSTAKERSSLVRIANSFGYNVPSYRSARATLKLESPSASEPYTLESFQRIVDANGVNWAYVGEEKELNIDDTINVYQGLPNTVNFSFSDIDDQTKTHIISNQAISIGNNADTNGLSKIVVSKSGEDDIVFTEVENVYTYVGNETLIYHLAVDPQNITYIKFLDTLNKSEYSGYSATFFHLLTQGQNIESIGNSTAILEPVAGGTGVTVNFTQPTNGFDFVLGSRPFSAPEIRAGFRQYYAGINTLVTLNDYKSFILNKQKSLLNVSKCLVLDSQTSTLEGLDGSDDFLEYPGIYFLMEETDPQSGIKNLNVEPTADQINTLKAEINKFKVTGIIPSYNGENVNGDTVGSALSAVNVQIAFNKLPLSADAFRKFVADYVNSKEIGSTLTSSEILNLVQTSEFAPSFVNEGIGVKLVNLDESIEDNKLLEFEYNEYMVCNVATGVVSSATA